MVWPTVLTVLMLTEAVSAAARGSRTPATATTTPPVPGGKCQPQLDGYCASTAMTDCLVSMRAQHFTLPTVGRVHCAGAHRPPSCAYPDADAAMRCCSGWVLKISWMNAILPPVHLTSRLPPIARVLALLRAHGIDLDQIRLLL